MEDGFSINKNKHIGKAGSGYNMADSEAECSTFGKTTRYPRSILKFDVVANNKKQHHSEKPQALLKYLINTYSNEGELVLDPFSGSGSTGIAAKDTRRKYILVEKDKEIYEKSLDRLKESGLIF